MVRQGATQVFCAPNRVVKGGGAKKHVKACIYLVYWGEGKFPMISVLQSPCVLYPPVVHPGPEPLSGSSRRPQ